MHHEYTMKYCWNRHGRLCTGAGLDEVPQMKVELFYVVIRYKNVFSSNARDMDCNSDRVAFNGTDPVWHNSESREKMSPHQDVQLSLLYIVLHIHILV